MNSSKSREQESLNADEKSIDEIKSDDSVIILTKSTSPTYQIS